MNTLSAKPTTTAPKRTTKLERTALNTMTPETMTTQEQAREVAVERLARLLERQTSVNTGGFTVSVAHSGEELHQLARLRMARSRYALKSAGDMERVGKGAWLRRRYC